MQPAAGLDQRVVGLRAARAAPASRSQTTARVHSSQTAGTSISPAWLRASHSSRDGWVANGSVAQHAHLDQRSGELLHAVPARVVQLPRAQRDEQLRLGRRGPRAAGCRPAASAPSARAAASAGPAPSRCPSASMCACDPADRGSTGAWPNTRPANLPGLEPADLEVQIPLIAQQVGDREHQLADLRVGAGEHRAATGRDPSPRTRLPRAAIAATSARAGRGAAPPRRAAASRPRARRRSARSAARAPRATGRPPRTAARPASPIAAAPPRLSAARGHSARSVSAAPTRLGRPASVCRQRGHASASPICAIRSAWICVIPLASRSARSRPDRWM